MVRLKNRWLVVRVDEARHVAPPVGVDGPNKRITTLPSKRDLFMLLSDGVIENFGITHCGALRDSKGKQEIIDKFPRKRMACSQNSF